MGCCSTNRREPPGGRLAWPPLRKYTLFKIERCKPELSAAILILARSRVISAGMPKSRPRKVTRQRI